MSKYMEIKGACVYFESNITFRELNFKKKKQNHHDLNMVFGIEFLLNLTNKKRLSLNQEYFFFVPRRV
jgi:hypothetical protein